MATTDMGMSNMRGLPWDIPPKGLIGNPNIQSRLIRHLGIRERSPAPTIAPEIVPVILVDDISGIDQSGMQQVRGAVAGATSITDAINPPVIALFNQAESRCFAKITKVIVCTNFASALILGYFDTSSVGGTAQPNEFFTNTELSRDTPNRPAVQIVTGVFPALNNPPTSSPIRIRTNGSIMNTLDLKEQPIVLIPGSNFVLGATPGITAGNEMTATFFWEEYNVGF